MNQKDFIKEADKGKNIFLTGAGGTGKTYILKEWLKENGKKNIIVAPTGIAAINIGGATIHSTFKLFGDLYDYVKKSTIDWKKIDVLVIDEVSMVSSDLFNYLDRAMKRYRRSEKPFGGIQVICIGDLKQLPPIVNTKRVEELNGLIYFLQSTAYELGNFVKINLLKSYRSSDRKLINLLGKARDGKDVFNSFKEYTPGVPGIHLASSNWIVDEINDRELGKLKGKAMKYIGRVNGKFNLKSVITPMELTLKEGAKVMLTKNFKVEGLYNGDIGIAEELHGSHILFKSDRLNKTFEIGYAQWDNIIYNDLGEEESIGQLIQLPFKLAYAFTIHKSQGLTLPEIIIYNDGLSQEMAYTALSRGVTYDNIYIK